MTPAEVVAALRLDEHCDVHRVVGAVAGISVGGERAAVGYGTADVSTGEPVTTETFFLAGSVTKAMTALLVNREIQRGSIGLDEDVRAVVSRFVIDEYDDDITVRDLLTHTAGFDGDLWLDVGDDPGAADRYLDRLRPVRLLALPGTRFSYSNGAYVVLGQLLEELTGQPYADLVRSVIAEPAGSDLRVGRRDEVAGPSAVGHARTGDDTQPVVVVEPVQGPAALAAAGARTWARLDDLLAFGETLLARHGDAALRAAAVEMRAPQIEVPDPNNGGTMALGVFLDDRWGTPVVFHDGGVSGQAAYLRVLPERDAVIAVMCTGGVPQVFHRHVVADLAAGLGLAAPRGAVEDPTVHIDPDRYVGRYAAAASQVAVARADTGLVGRITWNPSTPDVVSTPWLPLRPVNDCAFLAAIGGRDYVLLFPPVTERCDHVLAGLRLLPRASEESD